MCGFNLHLDCLQLSANWSQASERAFHLLHILAIDIGRECCNCASVLYYTLHLNFLAANICAGIHVPNCKYVWLNIFGSQLGTISTEIHIYLYIWTHPAVDWFLCSCKFNKHFNRCWRFFFLNFHICIFRKIMISLENRRKKRDIRIFTSIKKK